MKLRTGFVSKHLIVQIFIIINKRYANKDIGILYIQWITDRVMLKGK